MINRGQAKLVSLTMTLELKSREYEILCGILEELKAKKVNPNDKILLELRKLFQTNHDEIIEINRQINELCKVEKDREIEKYDPEKLFKKDNKGFKKDKEENLEILVKKENVLAKLIEKIKNIVKQIR